MAAHQCYKYQASKKSYKAPFSERIYNKGEYKTTKRSHTHTSAFSFFSFSTLEKEHYHTNYILESDLTKSRTVFITGRHIWERYNVMY